MRKVSGIALSVICGFLLCTPFALADSQPLSTVDVVAANLDGRASVPSRATFTSPLQASRPSATHYDVISADALGYDDATMADVSVAPGRLEMPSLGSVAVSADAIPPLMVVNPSRPMSLEGSMQGPLAIPEPESVLMLLSGLICMFILFRRPRQA